jgi:hypothetical protein
VLLHALLINPLLIKKRKWTHVFICQWPQYLNILSIKCLMILSLLKNFLCVHCHVKINSEVENRYISNHGNTFQPVSVFFLWYTDSYIVSLSGIWKLSLITQRTLYFQFSFHFMMKKCWCLITFVNMSVTFFKTIFEIKIGIYWSESSSWIYF